MLVVHRNAPQRRAAKPRAQGQVKTQVKAKKPPGISTKQPAVNAANPPQVRVRNDTGPPPYTPAAAASAPYPQATPQAQPNHANSATPPPPYRYPQPIKVERTWRDTLGAQNCDGLPEIITGPLQATLNGFGQWQQWGSDYIQHNTGVCDLISSKLDAVLTSIDGEAFSGDERELVIYPVPDPALRGGWGFSNREVSRKANNAISSAVTSTKGTNYFAKANYYANSKLPHGMPALQLFMPSYPLICLAAQYSQRVYTKPTGAEREAHVDADWRMGTKAMVIKSIPIDDRGAVVFAIRGSQTFMDWAVNLNSAPSSPVGFLNDHGNMCHSGFLAVARKMVKPVAARLRFLLEEDPSRSSCSLIMTGHSAGGAVASLLYGHMMAEGIGSELNILTGCFKRIHCITFGAPPVSLLPITKSRHPSYHKSLFLSFINEGDPVPRADRAYVRSLLDLYTSPAPGSGCITALLPPIPIPQPKFGYKILRPKLQKAASAPAALLPVWNVPPGSLSNAGRLVVLRAELNGGEDNVTAVVTTDQQLRGVVFGNPVMHMMKIYARRIEVLATKAVTAYVHG